MRRSSALAPKVSNTLPQQPKPTPPEEDQEEEVTK
jgi:hypothetical protein